MLPEHRNIQHWTKQRYGAQFIVQAEIDGQNCLPDKTRRWYQPDVVLGSPIEPHEILCIIEVENDPMRKGVVGACLLADCSIEEMQTTKVALIFVVYSDEGKKQIENFKEKVQIIRNRLPHLSSVEIVNDEEFKAGKVEIAATP